MRRASLLLAATLVAVLAAFLPRPAGAQQVQKGSVTIFTDGMAAPNGPMARAMTELSLAFDKGNRKLRVLPIMAYGGEGNVRDLLRFRGADFAVLNADVLAGASILKAYPEAPRKLRAITRLHSQKVFVFAQPEITSIEQLGGKKVAIFGPESIVRFTASTIFDLLKVKPEFVYLQEGVDLNPPADTQAVFLLEDDAKRLLPYAAPGSDYRPMALPRTADVAKFYAPAIIRPEELAAYGEPAPVSTLAVDTILATFDWATSQPRHADVSGFIDGLFAALPELRRDYPASIWQETDPLADIPGWQRYTYAEKARASLAAAKAAPASARPAPAKSEAARTDPPKTEVVRAEAVRAEASAKPEPGKPPLAGAPMRLSIVPYPPLTDQHAASGGLIGELTIAAMERAEPPYNRDIAFQWEKDRLAQVKTVLSDKTAELGVPLDRASCDELKTLGAPGAASCKGALTSEPLFKVLVLFFIGANSDFSFTGDDSLSGRRICLPADRDVNVLGESARALISESKLILARPASLIECLDVVQRGEADAVLTNELEGRLTISRLGLSGAFRMADQAVGTQNIELILAKDAPGAEQMLAALNKGIAKLKSEDIYARIVAKHITQINAGN